MVTGSILAIASSVISKMHPSALRYDKNDSNIEIIKNVKTNIFFKRKKKDLSIVALNQSKLWQVKYYRQRQWSFSARDSEAAIRLSASPPVFWSINEWKSDKFSIFSARYLRDKLQASLKPAHGGSLSSVRTSLSFILSIVFGFLMITSCCLLNNKYYVKLKKRCWQFLLLINQQSFFQVVNIHILEDFH